MSDSEQLLGIYRPEGKILWDSWFFKKNDEHHVFYLQAPPTENSDDRHDAHVSIGHAVSKDLLHWNELPTVLVPGIENTWDSKALWTGSVIEKDGMYFLFYTGRSVEDPLNEQKIGLATSKDLYEWEKCGENPIIEVDEYFYQMDFSENKFGKPGAWRDPFVFKDDKGDGLYHMTISARAASEEKTCNACIAHATSKDLIDWNMAAPLLSPKIFDEMETSQIIEHDGRYYLLFSAWGKGTKDSCGALLENGLYCYVSSKIDGEYVPCNEQFGLVFDYGEELYNMRLIHKEDDEFYGVSWVNHGNGEDFIGKLSAPCLVAIEDGAIRIIS